MELRDTVPFLAGAFTTFLAFIVNQWWLQHRDKKLRYERIISLLETGGSELEFQKGKLERLTEDLQRAIVCLRNRTQFEFPSYTLSASFLDTLKSQFVEFPDTTSLVPVFGNLQFELVHIQQRMDLLLETVKSGTVDMIFVARLGATLGLIDQNLKNYAAGEQTVKTKLGAIQKDYRAFIANSPFQLLLSDAPLY